MELCKSWTVDDHIVFSSYLERKYNNISTSQLLQTQSTGRRAIHLSLLRSVAVQFVRFAYQRRQTAAAAAWRDEGMYHRSAVAGRARWLSVTNRRYPRTSHGGAITVSYKSAAAAAATTLPQSSLCRRFIERYLPSSAVRHTASSSASSSSLAFKTPQAHGHDVLRDTSTSDS